MPRTLTVGLILAACYAAAACTVDQATQPSLTGPSELATALSVTATPDTINQDGASKSTVIIAAHGASGQAMTGLSVRVDMAVGGVAQDFGTLSARNLVTGPDGRVSVIYTAPPAPPPAAAGKISVVSIVASPVSNNAQGVVAAGGSSADIRLTPIGVILPPADAPTPAFVVSPTPVNLNVEARFDASRSCPGAANANGACLPSSSQSIVNYAWDYGDGDTAVGQTQTHIYKHLGTFTVRLTVTNDRSISASATQVVSVGASAGADGGIRLLAHSAGRRRPRPVQRGAVDRDGRTRAHRVQLGLRRRHNGHGLPADAHLHAGGLLRGDAHGDRRHRSEGDRAADRDRRQRKSGAAFTISPAPPVATGVSLGFDASASQAAAGATISTYTWTFGDGTGAGPSSSATTSHSYGAAGHLHRDADGHRQCVSGAHGHEHADGQDTIAFMVESSRLEDLRRRVQKDPASIAFAQLAEECRRSGQMREAVEVCRAGLAIHPGYLSARVTLGRAFLALGRLDTAHVELSLVLKSAPENLAAIRGLAEIYRQRGALPEALEQYQTALTLAPNEPELERAVAELSRAVAPAPTP